jgi:hypothetical protein
VAAHTITLTAQQEVALLAELEDENARRAAETPPLPALTADQMVERIVVVDLRNSLSTMDARLPIRLQLLRGLTAAQQTAVLNRPEVTPAQKQRLQQLLAE